MKRMLLSGAAIALVTAPAFADAAVEADAAASTDTIVIVGLKGDARQVAGSAAVITTVELQIQDYSDINRVLRAIPGINIQEADGYGLRPNIGLRGAGLDRSANVLIMEDGILAAPAPYAAPAAYYTPFMGRMAGVEVIKGAAGVRYGPRTQGGSINLLSTPIPDSFGGRIAVTVGEESARRIHAWTGGMTETAPGVRLGGLLEVFTDAADGFKTIDFSSQTTGFDLVDYGGRLRLEIDGTGVTHSFEARYQTSDETSDDTYMGLTDADFAASPNRRYAASANDQLNVDQSRYTLTWNADFDSGLRVTALAYRTEVDRNWFKVEGVNAGNGRRSLGAVLGNPSAFAAEYEVLTGAPGFVSNDNAIISRNNRRSYYAEGLQGEIAGDADWLGAQHRWRIGVRAHRDQEDRFQEEIFYRIDNSVLVQTGQQAPGQQANRISTAEALAVFVQNDITINDRLTLTPGVRFERIEGERLDYAATDPTRSGAATVRTSTTEVFIPGLGVRYEVNDAVTLFGGVHRGFAPAAPGSASDAETAINWEAGARWTGAAGYVEAVGFYNDYENLLGTCTASTGGGCTIGDQFDGGEVRVRGLELSAGSDLAAFANVDGVAIPVRAAYTFTDAEFQTAFQSAFGPWGNVQAGDELPYLAQHQWFASIGLERGRIGGELAVTWVGERRTVAGQGAIPAGTGLESFAVADLAVWYDLTDALRARVQVRNLTDEVYAASRSPAGLRPGAPRAVLFGLSANF